MNKDLKKAFVAIKDNRVVIFDTNLKDFVKKLNEVELKSGNYMFYYRRFEKDKVVEFVNERGITYHLQQII